MAEIKSTLDLVMERTKNLNFNEEEKQAQKREEAQKTLNGLIQKYLDQLITLEELPGKIADVDHEFQLKDRSLLVEVILDRIDLETIDGPLPALIERLCDVNVSELVNLARTHRHQIAEDRQGYLAVALRNLADHDGISGSAVRPNIEVDPQWQEKVHSRLAVTETTLLREKARLKSGLFAP